MNQISFDDFQKIDIRLGKIISAELLPNAKYTTHKLTIDFGPEIGIKVSGARAIHYSLEELTGKLVLGVVNLKPRQIGKLMSETLTLGVPDDQGECVFVTVAETQTPLGGKMY